MYSRSIIALEFQGLLLQFGALKKQKTFHFAPPKEQNPTCDVSSAALFAMAKRSLVSDSDRNSSINVEKVTLVKLQFDFLVACTLMDNLTTMFQTCQINRLGMFGMASFLEPLIIPIFSIQFS